MSSRRESLGFFEKMLGDPPGSRAGHGRWIGDAIRIHLSLLLNTRRGTLSHLPDYGVPTMSAFYTDYPDSMLQLQQVLEQLIRDYEPRLLEPRVQYIDPNTDEFRASFLIVGVIEEDDGERSRVKYQTTFLSDGRAQLQNQHASH